MTIDALNAIRLVAREAGWREDSQIRVLCDYINEHGNPEALEDYLRARLAEESDTSGQM